MIVVVAGLQILAFAVIMSSPKARAEFHKFLKRIDKESLCGYWSAVEALKGESIVSVA